MKKEYRQAHEVEINAHFGMSAGLSIELSNLKTTPDAKAFRIRSEYI